MLLKSKTQLSASRRITAHFAAIQCFYWVAFSGVFAFAAVYLRASGLDSAQVGLTMALGYLSAMVMQPVVGSWIDRSVNRSLNQWISGLAVLLFASVLLLAVLPGHQTIIMPVFILVETVLLVLQPMLYSLAMERINLGIDLNFGLSRALGSGSFALTSLVLGSAIIRTGHHLLPWVCAGTSLLLILTVWTFPSSRPCELMEGSGIEAPVTPARLPLNPWQWQKQYPGFIFLWLGLVLIMTNLNLFSNYQIHFIERIGGDSQTLGIATALAALLEIPVLSLFSWFALRLSARKLLRISAIFFVLKALATLLAANVGQYLFSQVFQAGGFALYLPASVYYFNNIMNPHDRVKGQAVLGMTFSLGGIIGSLLGGLLLERTTVVVTLAACLGLSAVGAVLAFEGSRKKGRAISKL
jgi:PPP family 3-phenylpropionic acid transporter